MGTGASLLSASVSSPKSNSSCPSLLVEGSYTKQIVQALIAVSEIPQANNGMEVIERSDSGVRDVWCAAADYVRAVLGDPVRARLYLIKPRGPSQSRPGRKSVGFTISPDENMAANSPSYSASLREIGTNLSVATSYTYCDDVLFEWIRDR